MGLLEDIGRTNAVSDLASSLEQRSRDMTATARQERVDTSTIELNTLEATKRRNELMEQRRAQEVRGKALDITTHPMYLQLDSESQKHALTYMSKGGFTDAAGVGTIGSIQMGMQNLEGSKEDFAAFTEVVIQGKRREFDAAQKELDEYRASGKTLDDKKGQMLQQRASAARGAYNTSIDTSGKHSQKLEQIEAAGRVAREAAEIKAKKGTVKERSTVDYLLSLGMSQEEAVDTVFNRKGKSPKDSAAEVYKALVSVGESEEAAQAGARSAFEFFSDLGKKVTPAEGKTGDTELDALMKELTEAMK